MTRDTTDGLAFEKAAKHLHSGIDVSKYHLYSYLKDKKICWEELISCRLLPDEAYIENNHLYVYEKKFQKVIGSADEKLQTCGFKIQQYQKLAAALGLKNVSYTYILSSWFKQPKYKDVLMYIKSIPGCDYRIIEEDKWDKILDT